VLLLLGLRSVRAEHVDANREHWSVRVPALPASRIGAFARGRQRPGCVSGVDGFLLEGSAARSRGKPRPSFRGAKPRKIEPGKETTS
jgi:hypothetical protein